MTLIVGMIVNRSLAVANPFIQVDVDRWLEIHSLVGQATLWSSDDEMRTAQQGDRFGDVGDRLITGDDSRSVLAIDTAVGFIDVFANTELHVQELRTATDGGTITKLQINRGQARLRLHPFTHDGSELEIETPAGWSAVRGTEFGVTVHPDGKTGVATLEGQVDTTAQGRDVVLHAGFQTLMIPGRPPSDPIVIDDIRATRLITYIIELADEQNVRFSGNIDPVSLLIIDNKPQTVDRNGDFDLLIPLSSDGPIQADVITPLGRQQSYFLVVPNV